MTTASDPDRRIIVLGGDGYLGWPTAMHFATRGWTVCAVDNYSRREIASANNASSLFDNPKLPERCNALRRVTNSNVVSVELDVNDYCALSQIVREFRPTALLHFAEQPSAPYSMWTYETARFTLNNNINTTFNAIWAILQEAPDCHLIKLGTMGEYGTPNIDIEEGWIDIHHRGRSERFLFPRQGPSLYHTTKIMDTDLIHFYCRHCGLRATDLMQGPVYGIHTEETRLSDQLLTNFHYDDIFGTVLNRFVVQAVVGIPLTVYGEGRQVRGFLNLIDSLRCIEIAALETPKAGQLCVANQFTQTFAILDLAARVVDAADFLGIRATIDHLPNPRMEQADHYYNPTHRHFVDRGLVPNLLTRETLVDMLKVVSENRSRIDTSRFYPRISWNRRAPGHQRCEARPAAMDEERRTA